MSLAVGVPIAEAVYCLVCTRWAYKRCCYSGDQDSNSWELAEADEFEPVPRMCRLTLAVYEQDLSHPEWAPPGGYQIKLENVHKKVNHTPKKEIVPPYLIYLDHDNSEIVLAMRGLNLRREMDYFVLWDNKLGKQRFNEGYVHHGLLRAACWLLNKEAETLKALVLKYPTYTLIFAGHSLGSGVASMMAILAVKFPFLVGAISRSRVRCYAIAPARCMSLNLAIEYADVIHSVILQDDFLPRTATPLEDIFNSIFCLPCLLCARCTRDTCIPETKLYRDPRRLYAPGRFYHIVERKWCQCGKFPPEVRTNIPVEGRFEHIVLSCNATGDHSIVAIAREADKALELMQDREGISTAPRPQKMIRQQTRAKEHTDEHRAALERAVSLDIPDAFAPSNDFNSVHPDDALDGKIKGPLEGIFQWDELLDELFVRDGDGQISCRHK